MFVSPREWKGRSRWAKRKSKDGFWREVRAYDADYLEQWLERSPATSAWLSERLGRPDNLQALSDAFLEWAARTDPPTPDTLLLGGRDAEHATCLNWLRGGPSLLHFVAPEAEEVVAFVHAVLRQLPAKQRLSWLDRAVVARTDEALRTAMSQPSPALIAAMGCDLGIARRFTNSGHHVVWTSTAAPERHAVVLGPLDRPRVSAELERIGVDLKVAEGWSRDARGVTSALRRLMKPSGPPGLGAELSLELAPLLLIGAWCDTNPHDHGTVLTLLGGTTADLERLLIRHATGVGAPLQPRGQGYAWVSRRDAWQSLGPRVTPLLRRFRDVAAGVLALPDPVIDRPVEEQWAAQLNGAPVDPSDVLRRGLAEAAVLLGCDVDRPVHQACAHDLVGEVLRRATTWQHWATLGAVLPTLAEAAPEVFLRFVRELIERAPNTVRQLRESSVRPGMAATDHLNGLVWALETLAWCPLYLDEACSLLARLTDIEADATPVAQRARDAFHKILLPWLPHTTADVAQRNSALRTAISRSGVAGMALLLELLPRPGFDSTTSTRRPAWRPWDGGWTEGVSPVDRRAAYLAVADLVVELVVSGRAPWSQVVPALHRLSAEIHRPRALALLDRLDINQMGAEQQLDLWSALRGALHDHRAFPKSKASLKAPELEVLERLYVRLTPADVVLRYGWLFRQDAKLPTVDGRDWHKEQQALARGRAWACSDILHASGVVGVLQLAEAGEPYIVGLGLASTEDLAACRDAMAASTGSEPSGWVRDFRRGLASRWAAKAGAVILGELGTDRLSDLARADLCLALPFEAATWDIVDGCGPEVRKGYWSVVRGWPRSNVPGEASRAVREFLALERAGDAIDMLGMHHHEFGPDAAFETRDIVDALTACRSAETAAWVRHTAGQLLDVLADAGPQWENQLLLLEWQWLEVLDHEREPALLLRAVREDPKFFVRLVSLAFRSEADDCSPEQPDPGLGARALRLLERGGDVPGALPEGGVDADRLSQWVQEVRRLAAECGRTRIADDRIGEMLARAPVGADRVWPHEAVRDLLERLPDTADLRLGFVVGHMNQRGVYSKAIGEGGDEERGFAARHRSAAEAIQARWPVAAHLLRDLADKNDHYAQAEDERGARDKDAFLWGATDEARLAAAIDAWQADGKTSFTHQEALAVVRRPDGEVRHAANALVARGRIVTPQATLFVTVPVEHRDVRPPPGPRVP